MIPYTRMGRSVRYRLDVLIRLQREGLPSIPRPADLRRRARVVTSQAAA